MGSLTGGIFGLANEYTGLNLNDSGQIFFTELSISPTGGSFSNHLYSNGTLQTVNPPNGYNQFLNYGMNNSGQVVGAATPGSGNSHTFLYDNGQWTDLGTNGGLTDRINDAGQIVGAGFNGLQLYSDGQWTNLPEPGAVAVDAAINESGQIIAVASTGSGSNSPVHTFVYSNGQWTDLGTPNGYVNFSGIGINASGQIAGNATANGEIHGFLYNNGQWTDLGALGPAGTSNSGMFSVLGINNSREVLTNLGLYSNGTITDLNNLLPAGTTVNLTTVFALNNDGQIVAEGLDNNNLNLYLLTPQQSTGTVISNGAVSPNTLTVSNSGQQVTVSATVNNNGSPATAGNVVFSLVGSNGTVVSDGPTGVAIGANGQASDTLTVPGGTAAGAYSLQVAYTNNNQTITQTFAGALNITPPATAPVITANPTNQSVTVGQKATFTASASGTPTPTVQWQLSGDGGKTWTNANLPSSNTIFLPNVTLAQNGLEVRAVFTNSAGSATTNAAMLTVTATGGPTNPPPPPPGPPALNVPPLLAFFDSLLGGTETANDDGTETVTDSFFGFPLLVSTFDSSGKLVSVDLLGIDVTFLFELL